MFERARAFASGLHFRFIVLVLGVALALLAGQLVTDTVHELRRLREARLQEALSITSVIARSLEKQFDMIELNDIEDILAKGGKPVLLAHFGRPKGEPVEALSLRVRCEPLDQWVLVHLMVYDRDDVRGALKPDGLGRKPRGDAQALRQVMAAGG